MNWKKESRADNDLAESILRQIATSIISVNVRGEIEFFNDAAQNMFGLQPDMVMSQSYLDSCGIYNVDGTQVGWEKYPTYLATMGEINSAFPILVSNNAVQNCSCLLTATPLRNHAGELIGALETWQVSPVTNNLVLLMSEPTNATSSALMTIEQVNKSTQIALLTEALPNTVWTTDANGLCTYLSSQWKSMTGREPNECLGSKWLENLHPDDRERTWSTWQRCVDEGEKFETEFRVANLENDYRWFLALGVPLKDSDQNVLQWVGSLTDVHDKKTQNQEMEFLVKERTLELQIARDEAVAARGVMAAALDAKSRFISTISHEVRTPMTGIIGLAEVMKLQDLGEENNESMRAIFDSAKRLLQLLNNVLDAAKLETGKVSLENRHFPLRSLLGDVRQLISPESNKKGLHVTGHYDAEVPEFVCGDELRLRQVLLNLAFNAVKFTSAGTIDISASVVERVDTTVRIRFTVADTGCGLTATQIEKIFIPFEQADLSVSRVSGGTGLGLAICKDLVTLMGGQIGVDSKIKVGSTFWFELLFNEASCSI